MTVYGSEPRGTHATVKVLVGVAVVVVLAAVFVVWRSAAGDATATPGVSAPATSPAPSAAPSSSSSPAPAALSTGSRTISLAGSGLYLSVDGDYAAMTTADRTVFSVVKGLADPSCFSFRAPGGKYMRHYNYRLRFDDPDGSDLFPKDATFCPLTGSAAVRLRSNNYPDYDLHSRGTDVYIDKSDESDTFVADSTFTFHAA